MKNVLVNNSSLSVLHPLRIALYSFGKCHTIDKYFQVMMLLDQMINDPRFDPCIVLDGNGFADDDLVSKYKDIIPIYRSEYLKTHDLGVEVVMIIDPYSIPKVSYYDLSLLGIKIIYKEYGVAGVEAGTGYLVNRSSYRYADLIITESSFTRDEILNKYPGKRVVVGSPAFDYVFQSYDEDPRFEKGKCHILWTPHHSVMSKESFDLIEGGVYSTFITFKDYLTGKFLEENPNVVLHIKYHPILGKRYNAYCKANGVDDTFHRFLKSIKNNPRIFIHDKEDYHSLFIQSDVILNDSISFTLEWLPTLKPMIVLEDDSKSKYSPFGESLINDCYYRARGINGLREKFTNSVSDSKYSARLEWIRRMMISRGRTNSSCLLDVIYDRYRKESQNA